MFEADVSKRVTDVGEILKELRSEVFRFSAIFLWSVVLQEVRQVPRNGWGELILKNVGKIKD